MNPSTQHSLQCLEVCCGTKSFSKACERVGWTCTTVDIDPKFEPTICTDIMTWDYTCLDVPDVFWAGIPCQFMSNASFKRDVKKGNEVALKVLEILEHFRNLNPNLLFGLENPHSSLLRKQDFMQEFDQKVLDYCCYATVPDFGYKKRTVIFGNIPFQPKMCPGPGKCENMVGKYHLCTAQQGRQLLSRAPLQQETWTRTQLYRYPPKMCDHLVQAIRNTPP